MALLFHKMPIILSTKTLKNLVLRYKEYTSKTDFAVIDEENYEKCRSTIALLQSGLHQIKCGQEKLEKRHAEIKEEYINCKSKSERKEIATEIEQIEDESGVNLVIAESEDLCFMLMARLDEAKCARDRMNVKLGYVTQKAQIENIEPQSYEVHTILDEGRISTETAENSTSCSAPLLEQVSQENSNKRITCRSIKPPQATLPKFYGNIEDFPEFWAIFETLVHKSNELHVMEKLLLLKESLEGRARYTIKGIQLVPENYNWIIQTLKDSYHNQAANRSKIIQKLVNMEPATNSADSCSDALDQIQVLINQMISAGYDVRKTCDPIWCETILAKFPQDVVKPVLISGQSQLDQTTEELMGHLKKEIAAKLYIENRLGHTIENRSGHAIENKGTLLRQRYTLRPQYGEECAFCRRNNHTSMACPTVTDQNSRRKLLKKENRCWKCCSFDHNSYDCHQPNCSQCGQKHHSSLCYGTNSQNEANQSGPPWNQSQHASFSTISSHSRQLRRSSGATRDNHRVIINKLDGLKNKETQVATSQLILMTAEGSIYNYRTKNYEKALFFFDTGAQKTVIQESLATRLGLPRHLTEICSVSGIGGHTEEFESHIVGVKISTAFGEELEFDFQTKPRITNGFPSVILTPSDTTFLKEHDICLANSKFRGEHLIPRVLVGLDHYHEIVNSTSEIKTPSGLHISNTVFGPAIFGKGEIPNQHGEIDRRMCYGLTAIFEPNGQKMLQKQFDLNKIHASEEKCARKKSTTFDKILSESCRRHIDKKRA